MLIVQFWQESSWPCKQLRPIFKRYSGLPGFKSKALFVEVDMDAARDVVAYAEVTKVPTYQCYHNGALVDSYEGTAPSAMREFVDRNIKAYCGTGMPMWQKLVVMVAAVAGAGLAYVYGQGSQSTEAIAQNARNEILSIKQRIVTAQGRLKNLEKANRGKQAKVQRKLIEQLNAQRRALERTQMNAEKQRGGKTGAENQDGATRGERMDGTQVDTLGSTGVTGAVDGTAQRTSRASNLSFDELARIRYKKQHGEVLYSDEEDAIQDGVTTDALVTRF